MVFDISSDDLPIKDIVKSKGYDIVIENDNEGHNKISRINYEISLLEVLKDKLHCKEIWVNGAHKYRNPDEELIELRDLVDNKLSKKDD